MTWASTDIIPATLNLSPTISAQAGSFENPVTVTISAKNSAGTAFNFAAATSLTIATNSGVLIPATIVATGFSTSANVSPSIASATSTAISFVLSAANLTTLFTDMPTSSLLSVAASDGTTALLIATGRLSVGFTA